MLGRRRRRWANIGPALDRWVVFAGLTVIKLYYMINQKFLMRSHECKEKQNTFYLFYHL